MKNKPISQKKVTLFIVVLLAVLSFNSYGQYLPLAGGTMTGNLNMNSATQIQSPYYGFDAFFTQPSTSANFAIFPNISTGTIDFVGQGWRFIPANSSTYAAPLVTIDNSGNTTMAGGLTAKSATVYNAGTATVFAIGSGITGKTMLQLGTSSDAGGYGSIQSVSAQGSAWGNVVINSYGGNVLIGRTTQNNTSYILDVNGPAHATSFVVNSGGADFVFAPKYKLAPLSFVEKYINQNHHLPEIPTAKEMQANGLNVGENQTKLLQKVEELTLYLIENDKKEKEQQQKILEQEQRIKSLEAKLDQLLKNKN